MIQALVSVTLTLTLLFGCMNASAAPSATSAARSPVNLVLANFWTGTRIPLMEANLQKFHELYPWITVTNQVTATGKAIDEKYFVSIAAGTPPDVWMVQRNRIPEFVEKGMLQPLDPFMQQDAFNMNIFYKSEQQACQYKDKTYSLPMPSTSLALLYYNRTLLAAGGYGADQAPKTWDELRAMASRLQRIAPDGRVEVSGGDISYLPTYRLAQYAYTNGAKIFNGPFDINYLTSQVRETVNWAVDFVNRVPTGGSIKLNTRVFESYGEWHYYDLKTQVPDLDLGIALLPHGPNGEMVNLIGGGWSYGIPVGVKHPYESWLLIKFLTASEEGAKVFAFAQGRPSPVSKFTQDRRYYEQNPYWGVIGETLNRSIVITPSPVSQQIIDADIKYWTQLLKRTESPEAVLTKLQDEVSVIVSSYLAAK